LPKSLTDQRYVLNAVESTVILIICMVNGLADKTHFMTLDSDNCQH